MPDFHVGAQEVAYVAENVGQTVAKRGPQGGEGAETDEAYDKE